MTGPPVVVVYGGHGFFGKLVVEYILAQTDAHIVIAGRTPPNRPGLGVRVTSTVSDQTDLNSVCTTISNADVVVHCAGPYQSLPLNPLRAAIECGVDYVDLADDRTFVQRAHQMHQDAVNADISVLCGMSVLPGMTLLLTQVAASEFDNIQSVRTIVAPGTAGSRGIATLSSYMSGAGRTFSIPRGGQDALVYGCSENEWINFPAPLGNRLVHLGISVADYDLVPRYFGAQTVEFKVGSEFSLLNRALGCASYIRVHTGFPPLGLLSPLIRMLIRIVGVIGTHQGGVIVEISGSKEGAAVTQHVALVSVNHGFHIPSVLAGLGTAALLRAEIEGRGIIPLHVALSSSELLTSLTNLGFKIWRKSSASTDWAIHS